MRTFRDLESGQKRELRDARLTRVSTRIFGNRFGFTVASVV